jgi:hypothetical protein
VNKNSTFVWAFFQKSATDQNFHQIQKYFRFCLLVSDPSNKNPAMEILDYHSTLRHIDPNTVEWIIQMIERWNVVSEKQRKLQSFSKICRYFLKPSEIFKELCKTYKIGGVF